MTHDDHRDLSGLLRGIADDAAHAPRARSLEDMAATARTHGLAARRRRTAARSLVAAASVALVAVGGVLVAQNIGGSDGTPPPATNTDLPAACGTTFTPPKGSIEGLDLVLSTATPPLTARSLADLPHVVAVLHEGAAEKSLTLGSTGYVSYTVVQDGKIVALPGAMPEPFTQAELTAGGDPSEAFQRTASVACDPSGTLPAGTYQVWATVDGTLVGDASRQVDVVGGPWDVTIDALGLTMGTQVFACGESLSDDDSRSLGGEYRTEIIGPERPVTPAPVLPDLLRIDPAITDGSTHARTVTGVWTYLTRDGKIVSAHKTEGTELMAWFGPEDATDIMPGTSRIVDGLRVGGSATACDSSGLLPAGDYQASVILEFTSIGPDDLPTRTITASNTVDLMLGDPTDAPSQGSTMLACGDPTAEITSSTVAGGDTVTLTLDGTATRVPAGEVGDGAMRAQIRHAKGSTAWYTGDAAEVYLLRDETVVAASRTRQGSDKWHTGELPASILPKYPERDALVADIPTTDCDGTALPDGTYTLLVVVPVTQLDGTTETATEIISVRQDLTIGGGPELPTKDASATFPACGAEVPGFQGDSLEVSGTPEKTTVGLDNAHGGEMTVTNIGDTRLAGSFPGVVGGVLTRNGIVVGQIPDNSNDTPTSGYDLARGDSTDLTWNTDLRSCSTGEHVGAGTYEVWATATLTGTDGTKESATGKVATVTVNPERVTD
ncbi:hypothetical protein IGS67_00815 [Flavimobilis sp. GY10621]|uniref:Uncharacterized protein n=1 Tax=Flavimobilis rhizosphaerae TaxID=2775421 RepID=A0ABR9DLM6_9MICO|nr:hypothetical protein [Flavimobilis rhizosphaerae]MBD9698041.1 hypothetical protein [Flavimobilis rhizosphaerae]